MWRAPLGRIGTAVTIVLATAACVGAPAARAQNAGGGPVHWSFEDGTLDGWTVVSGSFDKLIDDRPNFRNRGTPFNKEGTYYLSTMEQSNGGYSDGYTGVVESPRFRLTHPTVSVLVAGGSSAQQYVAVCTVDSSAPDGCHEIARVSGPQDEVLQYETLDVSQAVGQTAFVAVVDHSTGGWGHLSVDDVRANVPAMPRGLRTQHDAGGVTVDWNAVQEPGVTAYAVSRSTRFDGGYSRIGAVTGTSYRDTTATPDGKYFYRVERETA
jgi:hypothetical protein